MRNNAVPAFVNDSNVPSAIKTLVVGTSVYNSEHLNNGNFDSSDGEASVGALIDTASLTIAVTCALFLGPAIGYGPYRNLLDESDTRVNTFDSTKVFQSSLFNQSWFTSNHLGFKLRFTITGSISGGEELKCEVSFS